MEGLDAVMTKGLCIATRYRSIDELVATLHQRCDETSIFVTTIVERPLGREAPFALLLADRRPALVGWCVVREIWTDGANPFGRPGTRLGLHRLTARSQQVFDRLQHARATRTFEGDITEVTPVPAFAPARPPSASEVRRVDARVPVVAPAPTLRSPEIAPGVGGATAEPPGPAAPTPARRRRRPITSALPIASAGAGGTAPSGAAPGATTVETTVEAIDDEQTTPLPRPRRPAFPRGTPALGASAPAAPANDAERMPGAALVLPANPLTAVSAAALEGLVDCTLYEEHLLAEANRGRGARVRTALHIPNPDASMTIVLPPSRALAALVFVSAVLAIVVGFVIVYAIARYLGA